MKARQTGREGGRKGGRERGKEGLPVDRVEISRLLNHHLPPLLKTALGAPRLVVRGGVLREGEEGGRKGGRERG